MNTLEYHKSANVLFSFASIMLATFLALLTNDLRYPPYVSSPQEMIENYYITSIGIVLACCVAGFFAMSSRDTKVNWLRIGKVSALALAAVCAVMLAYIWIATGISMGAI